MRRLWLAPLAFAGFLVQSAYLALGQIWANKSRSFLTTLGIIIGVASVTAVIAALTGLKTKVVDKFESVVGSNTIFVFNWRPQSGRQRYAPWWSVRLRPENFVGLLDHCPSVARFARVCGATQDVRFRERVVENVSIRGIDSTWHEVQGRSTIEGRPFSAVDSVQARYVCLVTPKLRDRLALDRDCTGQRIVIGRSSYRIVGVVEEAQRFSERDGGSELEVFVPFETGWKQRWDWMMVMASARSALVAEDAQAEMRFFLRRMRQIAPGEPDNFRLEVMKRHLEEIQNVALIMTAVAGGIVGISLLVGGIGIMNIMLVSVSERTREIGLRKAVGARPSAVLLQFLVEAVVLCLLGGFVGVGAAQGLTALITRIPGAELEMAYIPMWAIGIAFGFSAVVGVCFGMFPALKAAQLDPIEALRHE